MRTDPVLSDLEPVETTSVTPSARARSTARAVSILTATVTLSE